jgi:hypothetical protein
MVAATRRITLFRFAPRLGGSSSACAARSRRIVETYLQSSTLCSVLPEEAIQSPSWCADATLNREMKLFSDVIESLSNGR